MLRYGGVEDVRLDAHTGTAFITFNDVERAKKLVGACMLCWMLPCCCFKASNRCF
jgi:hypothetical protein